jgi:glyoxylase-like metal-dependent hydrolase (beta-lactamase superfamily II)
MRTPPPLASIEIRPHPVATELLLSTRPELRDQVAAWAVDGLVIDSGGLHTADELGRWVGDARPAAILLGHSHEDHSAGASILGRDVPVYGSAGTAARLRQPARIPSYRARLWGQPAPVRVKPVPEGLPLRPIPLPGHAPDQLGYLHERTGWLFSGDLVLRMRPRVAMPGEDPWAMMNSLRAALALAPTALATSHRSLIAAPAPVLAAVLGYLEDTAGRILEMRRRGLTGGAIVLELFGAEPLSPTGVTWREYSGGEFSAARFVRSFLRQ